jgi:energy-coupling factor transport system ATP-binding protein
MICVDGVGVRFGSHTALEGVTLEVRQGECVLVMGASGCGKTTLARCMSGFIPHASPAVMSGRVLVDGRSTSECSLPELATSVGFVFQTPSTQLFNLRVLEEVEFGPRNLGQSEAEIRSRSGWALEATGTAHLRDRLIRELSGGEQQRVALAAVLAMRPRYLLLDEPTASLDKRGSTDLVGALKALRDTGGATVLVMEHRLGEVAHLAERTIVMDQGRVVADQATAAVFERRDWLRTLGVRRPGEALREDWVKVLEPAPHPSGPPLVALGDIEAGYGRREVLRGFSAAIHEGEFVALVGDNGSGKTTLARVLAGLVKPRRGAIEWRRQAPRLGRDVGLLFENPSRQLFCNTVREEVEFGPRNLGCFDANALSALLVAADLCGLGDRSPHGLSCGQRQRTALAAVLALRPRLIILDEPTHGQDWGHLSRLMEFLTMLNAEGTSILLITHDYKLVHRYASRVLVIGDGRLLAEGRPRDKEKRAP